MRMRTAHGARHGEGPQKTAPAVFPAEATEEDGE